VHNFGNSFVGISFFLLFDEICIFNTASRIEKYVDAILISKFVHFAHIFHRNRLASGHIYGNGKTNVRNIFGAFFVDQPL
jgi:hypothetical protein